MKTSPASPAETRNESTPASSISGSSAFLWRRNSELVAVRDAVLEAVEGAALDEIGRLDLVARLPQRFGPGRHVGPQSLGVMEEHDVRHGYLISTQARVSRSV